MRGFDYIYACMVGSKADESDSYSDQDDHGRDHGIAVLYCTSPSTYWSAVTIAALISILQPKTLCCHMFVV